MQTSPWYSIRFLSVIWILLCSGLYAQDREAVQIADPGLYIGWDLGRLVEQFGTPDSVQAVRGLEPWQDDVVFVYDQWDVYLYRDTVWQLSAPEAYGVKKGQGMDAVLSLLGEPLHRLDNAFVYHLPARSWPLRLRVAFDGQSRVEQMYVYRSDF